MSQSKSPSKIVQIRLEKRYTFLKAACSNFLKCDFYSDYAPAVEDKKLTNLANHVLHSFVPNEVTYRALSCRGSQFSLLNNRHIGAVAFGISKTN